MLEACGAEFCKQEESNEVIYGTLVRSRRPSDTGCSGEY
jgi:hypothetical protein